MIKWYSDEMVEGCTTDRYFVSFTGALNPNSEVVGHSASETHVQLFAFDFEPLASARPSSSASDSYPPLPNCTRGPSDRAIFPVRLLPLFTVPVTPNPNLSICSSVPQTTWMKITKSH